MSFLAADLRFHPIQRSLLCQVSAHAVADSPLRSASDSISLSTSSSVASIFSAVAMRSSSNSAFTSLTARSLLALAQRHPVHIHRTRIHALRGQRADRAFEAQIHLVLDQRFGNREVMPLHNLAPEFFARLRVLLMLFRRFQILAHLSSRISSSVECRRSPRHPWRIRRSARAASFP